MRVNCKLHRLASLRPGRTVCEWSENSSYPRQAFSAGIHEPGGYLAIGLWIDSFREAYVY